MLLLALIALGGKQVSKTELSDIFWPDSEGDKQLANLKTTLHRLRQLLGVPKVIIQTAAHISLNPRLCWVDSWQFERLANEATHEAKPTLNATHVALDVYRNDFLCAYQDEFWTFQYRKKLQRLRGQLERDILRK